MRRTRDDATRRWRCAEEHTARAAKPLRQRRRASDRQARRQLWRDRSRGERARKRRHRQSALPFDEVCLAGSHTANFCVERSLRAYSEPASLQEASRSSREPVWLCRLRQRVREFKCSVATMAHGPYASPMCALFCRPEATGPPRKGVGWSIGHGGAVFKLSLSKLSCTIYSHNYPVPRGGAGAWGRARPRCKVCPVACRVSAAVGVAVCAVPGAQPTRNSYFGLRFRPRRESATAP